MATPPIEDALRWTAAGTALVTRLIKGLDDAALRGPSLLPGWTRGHVVGHIAGNAEGLTRLLRWAATGERQPMYASQEKRDADIAERAAWSRSRLTRLHSSTARAFDAATRRMDDGAWAAEVEVRGGREVAARAVPWMRAREVMVHGVDLDAGAGFADLPADFLAALADDIVRQRSRTPDLPVTLTADDVDWRAALPGAGAPLPVRGTLAALTAYLAGRGADGVRVATDGALSADVPVPALSAWL